MSDVFYYHATGLLVLAFVVYRLITTAFYAGELYGSTRSKAVVNVICEETSSGFIFNELLSKAFICQSADYPTGIEMLTDRYPNKTLIVSVKESYEDESV